MSDDDVLIREIVRRIAILENLLAEKDELIRALTQRLKQMGG